MKKLLLLFIALSGALHSKGQCPNPLGSSGGQQFGLCNPIYTVDFRNTTDCDLAIWWNYKTNCTDHLIQSYGPGTNVVPATPPPGTWSSHQVYEIKSILPNAGDGGNCNPSKCNAPCFISIFSTNPNKAFFALNHARNHALRKVFVVIYLLKTFFNGCGVAEINFKAECVSRLTSAHIDS